MWRDPEKNLPLPETLSNNTEIVVRKISQTAMDDSARATACAVTEVLFLKEDRLEPAHGGVSGHPGSNHSSANDGQIELRLGKLGELPGGRQ